MKTSKILLLLVIIIIFGFGTGYSLHHLIHPKEEAILLPEHPYFLLEDVNEEVLYKTLVHYEFPEPEFITAQAVLETGNFKSRLCLEHNNLFGLYNSNTNEYFKFDSWISCVFGYRDMILNRKPEKEKMSIFCSKLGYAEDPKYIDKIVKIAKQIKEKYESN